MRIVVKVGTNVLTDAAGKIQEKKIKQIAEGVSDLWKRGHEVILVSSGAIGTGRGLVPALEVVSKTQVWAAVGQPTLMSLYANFFKKFDLTIGQCLLLRNDFTNRERYDNSIRTIEGLLAAKCLPIINENDVVASADLTVGDNDLLAAMVAVASRAVKLILLTNQKGLYTGNPDLDKNAKLLETVTNVDSELEKLCSNKTSALGRGGMLSKVRAAKQAVHAGIETYIAAGSIRGILTRILEGEQVGTKFLAAPEAAEMSEQKRWLVSAKGFGQVVIDDGAVQALGNGKSLLLPGIITVKGLFDKGEIVEVMSKSGAAVAYGKVGYDQQEILKAVGVRRTAEGKGKTLEREVIHRNYMVVLK